MLNFKQTTHSTNKTFQIAIMFGVSRPTVKARMEENHISKYSQTTDDELRAAMISIKDNFPSFGLKMIRSGLNTQYNIHVQRQRIEQILREIDPIGVATRWATCVKRRTYSVPGSMYLWHNDGNHKVMLLLFFSICS